ncbi:MAG: N-acetyl-gamma-glutamyl-phosphate reductase [Armatimonadetes bacterium]|nr:N-acetyl-gamma-glutamyl-phosphate reductase [Armatimonadota bacterium]
MAIRVSIVGASGYGGGELARLLAVHPEVQLVHLTAETKKDEEMSVLFPNLAGFVEGKTVEADATRLAADSDVVFLSLPSGVAMKLAPELLKEDAKVIDLSPDFRLKAPHLYDRWYKMAHASPEYLDEAVYGLPETHRVAIRTARLVANPGCYPAAAVIALAPLLQSGKVTRTGIIVDAKSGVSGAGRGLSMGTHFSEVNENVKAYNVTTHRHTPEIEQELSEVAGESITVTFTPHLIPMTRGILVTAYVPLAQKTSTADLMAVYREAYSSEPFVRIVTEGLPQTKATLGSNFCDVTVRVDERAGLAISIAAIDNLVKGASGCAIQNMNLMFGLPEETGLNVPGLYP